MSCRPSMVSQGDMLETSRENPEGAEIGTGWWVRTTDPSVINTVLYRLS